MPRAFLIKKHSSSSSNSGSPRKALRPPSPVCSGIACIASSCAKNSKTSHHIEKMGLFDDQMMRSRAPSCSPPPAVAAVVPSAEGPLRASPEPAREPAPAHSPYSIAALLSAPTKRESDSYGWSGVQHHPLYALNRMSHGHPMSARDYLNKEYPAISMYGVSPSSSSQTSISTSVIRSHISNSSSSSGPFAPKSPVAHSTFCHQQQMSRPADGMLSPALSTGSSDSGASSPRHTPTEESPAEPSRPRFPWEFDCQSMDTTQSQTVTRRNEPPRFNCDGCGKSYATFSGLSKHKRFHCTSEIKKEFSCKFCDKTYSSLGALKMHIRTHTLPCKCPLCGKAFSRPWLLQGHIRTHTGEKPFKCQHCARAFADRSNLRAHLQTHTDVKKYNCTKCSKTFSRMSLLTKHEENCSSTPTQ